jgi:hypothetical protein
MINAIQTTHLPRHHRRRTGRDRMSATFTPDSGIMEGITIENVTDYDHALTLAENHTAATAAMLAKIN